VATSKRDANKASKILRNKSTAAKALSQAPAKRGARKMPAKTARSAGLVRRPPVVGPTARPASKTNSPHRKADAASDDRERPESVDEQTIARLVAEAEGGIPAEKLRRRGRPAIGDEAATTYSVRLPDDLVILTDERSAIDSVSRGETIRRALIEYLTK